MKNGKIRVKNVFDKYVTKQEKNKFIKSNKLKKRLTPYPKDREGLLFVINNYLSLTSVKSMSRKIKARKGAKSPFSSDSNGNPYVTEDEYTDLPVQIFELESCGEKALKIIFKLLTHRDRAIKRVKAMTEARIPAKRVNEELKTVALYNLVFAKYLPILNKQHVIDAVTIKTAQNLYKEVCSGVMNISSTGKKDKVGQDTDILAALSYVGVGVEEKNGLYRIVDKNNGNGITYYEDNKEKNYALSVEAANEFVREFLNQPLDTRRFKTPSQVFATYISEAETKLGIKDKTSSELKGIFGEIDKTPKAYFKDLLKDYSRNSIDWKTYQREFITKVLGVNAVGEVNKSKQDAKKIVITEILEGFLNDVKILEEEQINLPDYRVADISRDFGLNVDTKGINADLESIEKLEDMSFRIVSTIHSTLQNLRTFASDVIDDYSSDYLIKENALNLLDSDRAEYQKRIAEFEELLQHTDEQEVEQIKYINAQIEELKNAINDPEYEKVKADLIECKNTYRIMLIQSKYQKVLVDSAIQTAKKEVEKIGKKLLIQDKLAIVREVLSAIPVIDVKIEEDEVKSTLTKDNKTISEENMSLKELDEMLDDTSSKMTDETKEKVIKENNKLASVTEENQLKRTNAFKDYVSNIANFGYGVSTGSYMAGTMMYAPVQRPDTSKAEIIGSINNRLASLSQEKREQIDSRLQPQIIQPPFSNIPYPQPYPSYSYPNYSSNNTEKDEKEKELDTEFKAAIIALMKKFTEEADEKISNKKEEEKPSIPEDNRDIVSSERVEPSIIPYVVGYEKNELTKYGNILEKYATLDRYKYLLTTNNNPLYTFIESKKNGSKPNDIILEIKIRLLKVAFNRMGVKITDNELSKYEGESKLNQFVTKYTDRRTAPIIMGEYTEMLNSIDLDLLQELIACEDKAAIEEYYPADLKEKVTEVVNIIATVADSIMANKSVKSQFNSYSSSMKQNYVSEVIDKINEEEIPLKNLSSQDMQSRLYDYYSFSIRGQNVLIQNTDSSKNGLSNYPRSLFFKQKDIANDKLESNNILTFEQNELLTGRNDIALDLMGDKVVNLFGSLYTYSANYNKVITKLKGYYLTSGVKFFESIVDALTQEFKVKVIAGKSSGVETRQYFTFVEEDENPYDTVFNYDDDNWFVREGFVLNKVDAREYAMLLSFGLKYGLDFKKTKLTKEFYDNNMLNLNKLNRENEDLSEDVRNTMISVIRNVMTQNNERFVDYIDYVNKQFIPSFKKMIYIAKKIDESENFAISSPEGKFKTLEALDKEYNTKAEDKQNSHFDIDASVAEIERYTTFFMHYALSVLFEKYAEDKRFIFPDFSDFFEERKKNVRNFLLQKIKAKEYLNGYEIEVATYFELDVKDVPKGETREKVSKMELPKVKQRLQNIDIIFNGIYVAFINAMESILDMGTLAKMQPLENVLEVIGSLEDEDEYSKELKINLPNNQTIICNIKGFIQQYLFRYIINKDNEIGPLMFVVDELASREEFAEIANSIDKAAEILSEEELGVNLFMGFSSIEYKGEGYVLRVGENISTLVDNLNSLDTMEEIYEMLDNSMFYNEAVESITQLFTNYIEKGLI